VGRKPPLFLNLSVALRPRWLVLEGQYFQLTGDDGWTNGKGYIPDNTRKTKPTTPPTSFRILFCEVIVMMNSDEVIVIKNKKKSYFFL
jgi:hypothetical protein